MGQSINQIESLFIRWVIQSTFCVLRNVEGSFGSTQLHGLWYWSNFLFGVCGFDEWKGPRVPHQSWVSIISLSTKYPVCCFTVTELFFEGIRSWMITITKMFLFRKRCKTHESNRIMIFTIHFAGNFNRVKTGETLN